MNTAATIDRALSVRQLARRWAISPRKVRAMIRRGILSAFNVGTTRTQLRIPPETVIEAETKRLAVRPVTPRRRRREQIDPEIAALLNGGRE
jgi:hypothetical protein